ncbi:MAG: hypothetical protein BEN18_00710 [Epulopiscium sp. Nuni2H_MBin001]|nr:MAG: hypothetical protein BEN18_00710 [Epulopiscium sp. Nuni2H_MBin001]
MIIQFISSYIATLSFCIIFNVLKKHLYLCGFVGAVGWTIYYFLAKHCLLTEVFSSFIAALVVTSISNLLSRRRHAPITIFLIPGIIPLVPGIGLYRTAYYLLFKDFPQATEAALTAFQVSGVIAASITIVAFLPAIFTPAKK